MEYNDLEEKIVEFLTDKGRASWKEIKDNIAGFKQKEKNEALENLLMNNEIDKFVTKTDTYYLLVEGITYGRMEILGSELKKIQFQMEDDLNIEKKEVEKLKEEINKIYLNFLTVIAVFISIFALIYTNTNIIYEISNSNIDLFVNKIIIINISVTVMILVLIIALRLFIINSLKKK